MIVSVMVFIRWVNGYPFNKSVEIVWMGEKSALIIISQPDYFIFRGLILNLPKNIFLSEIQLIKNKVYQHHVDGSRTRIR